MTIMINNYKETIILTTNKQQQQQLQQRRNSSPDCIFPFTINDKKSAKEALSSSSTTSKNLKFHNQKEDNTNEPHRQKDDKLNNKSPLLLPFQFNEQSIDEKDVFSDTEAMTLQNNDKNNDNKTVLLSCSTSSSSSSSSFYTPSLPPTPPLSSSTNFLLRSSFSDYSKTSGLLPQQQQEPFSSSSCCFYNSNPSSFTSIVLPAAPSLSVISSYSSLKKKQQQQKRKRLSRVYSDISTDAMRTISSSSTTPITGSLMPTKRESASSDIELATEIGQGLLSEVRRMQSLLAERQEAFNSLELEKTENQQRIHDLIQQIRFKSDTEEQLREQIWNLELSKQDLSHQIQQLSWAIAKTQSEKVKRESQSSDIEQELEKSKQAQVDWQAQLQQTQAEYETKLQELKTQLHEARMDKFKIGDQLEDLQMAYRKVKIIEGEQLDKRALVQEVQSLQDSLDEALELVESLKLNLEQERQQKVEVDALLREAQETIEQMQQEQSLSSSSSSSSDTDSSIDNDSLQQEIESAESRIQQEKKQAAATTATPHITMPLSINSSKFEKVLPFVMHTMMGEWLLKYTRSFMGAGISNKSHPRFFWLHPYTKTLYWSQQEPGVQSGEFQAKSVSIEFFSVVKYNNEQVIIIQSSSRDIHVKCIEKESHDKWVKSLEDLLKEEEEIMTLVDEEQSSPTTPIPSSSGHCSPQPRLKKIVSLEEASENRKKRLSFMFEKNQPSTVRLQQKQKWRLSAAAIDASSFSSSTIQPTGAGSLSSVSSFK